MTLSQKISSLRQLGLVTATLLLAAFVLIRVHRLLAQRRLARQKGCRPISGSVGGSYFFGLDVICSQIHAAREHKLLQESAERFLVLGNTFESKVLLRHSITTIEPENIKTILSLNFEDYGVSHRQPLFKPLLGTGIINTDGKDWAVSRSLIKPSFSRDQVADLTVFESLMPDLFALIPGDGSTTVDLQDLFFCYTIDSATDLLFGESAGSLKQVLQQGTTFAEAFNYAQEAIRMRSVLGPLNWVYRDLKARQCNEICRDFVVQFVNKAILITQSQDVEIADGKRQKYVLSNELARRTSDKLRILDELMNVLIAGRDTTASLLSNMFFMLAKNPAIWAKLRAEVANLNNQLPTYEALRKLRYLRCCINESLRIHPVVPINGRQALLDTVLPVGGGPDGRSPIFVGKGTSVSYNIYAMHRRKDFYGLDADEFRPERWEDGKLHSPWQYLPFNGGPRVCIGQQYALTEVAYVTARMAQAFSTLASRDSGPWEEQLGLSLSSRNGTKVCLTTV